MVSMRIRIYLSLYLHEVPYVQALGEALSHQKGTSCTSRQEISSLFFYFCGSFLPSWIQIADQNQCGSGSTKLNSRYVMFKSQGNWNVGILCCMVPATVYFPVCRPVVEKASWVPVPHQPMRFVADLWVLYQDGGGPVWRFPPPETRGWRGSGSLLLAWCYACSHQNRNISIKSRTADQESRILYSTCWIRIEVFKISVKFRRKIFLRSTKTAFFTFWISFIMRKGKLKVRSNNLSLCSVLLPTFWVSSNPDPSFHLGSEPGSKLWTCLVRIRVPI